MDTPRRDRYDDGESGSGKVETLSRVIARCSFRSADSRLPSGLLNPRGSERGPASLGIKGSAPEASTGPTTAATYEAKRPVKTPGTAEWREYRAKFWYGTEAIGAWSEVVRVTVEGQWSAACHHSNCQYKARMCAALHRNNQTDREKAHGSGSPAIRLVKIAGRIAGSSATKSTASP